MTPVTLSRRERNKEHTRAAIHEAALSLTEERGLAAVTVEAIAERADVSPRTFSNYFAGKEEAVLGFAPDTAAELAEALARRPAGESPLEALQNVLVDLVSTRYQPREVAARRIRIVGAEPQLKARLAGGFDQLTAGLVKGLCEREGIDPESGVYPSLVVSACANAARCALLWWSTHTSTAELEEVLEEVFDRLRSGLDHPEREP